MTERGEIRIRLECNSESFTANPEFGHCNIEIVVSGVLRRRGIEWHKDQTLTSVETFELGTVAGEPVMVLQDQQGNAERVFSMGTADTEENNYKFQLKDRAVVSEGGMMAGRAGHPHWHAPFNHATRRSGKVHLFSALFPTEDARLHLQGGPWQMHLFEFEDDTVKVDVIPD
jgi:hypothetical protein